MDRFDLVVIGGGTAYRVAHEAGRAGRRVALIERGPLGGTCPNRGCIPSKLLLSYAQAADAVRRAERFHVAARLEGVNQPAILRDSFAYTADTDERLQGRLPDSVELLRGHAELVGDKTLQVGERQLRGDTVILATGTRPRQPDDAFLVDLPWWTSEDVFELQEAPESIAIVGGGLVGCEMAQVFAGLGVETTLVQRGPHLAPREDEELRPRLRAALAERIDVRCDTQVTGATHDVDGFHLELSSGDSVERLDCEALLYAIGRVPNTDHMGIENTGIALDEDGYCRVDEHLQTSVAGIYAAGDVNGRHPFTHAGSHEARYLTGRLLEGSEEPLEYGPMPHAIFTHPPLATVGATEQELRERGVAYHATSTPFDQVVMGRALQAEHGLCKLLCSPDGAILGCHLLGPESPSLIQEVVAVMRWRNHVSSLTDIIHIHPAMSEVVRDTARKMASRLRSE